MTRPALAVCALCAACTMPGADAPGGARGAFEWKNLAPIPNPNPGAAPQPSRMHPFATYVTPGGEHALVTLRGSEIEPFGELAVIDLAAKKVSKRLEVGHRPVAIAARRQGDFAVVASMYSPYAAVIDLRKLEVVGQLEVGHYAMDFVFDERGEVLFHTDRKNDSIKRWRVTVAAGSLAIELTAEKPAGNNPMPVGLSPDGAKVYVGDEGGMTVRVYSAADLAPIAELFLNAPIFDLEPMGGWVVVTTLNDTNGLPCERDGDYPGVQGDGIFPQITDHTCSRGFADVQNEIAFIDPAADRVAIRYTSDSAEISEVDREGDYDPSLMKVQGSLPYTIAVAGPARAWVTMGSSWEVAELALDGALPPAAPKLEMSRVFDTGMAPRGLSVTPDGQTLVVANLLSETVSLISTQDGARVDVAVGKVEPAFPATSAEIGELLFHTSKLATDGDISCIHCHPDVENDGKNWNVDVVRGFGRRSAMMLRDVHETRPLLIEGVFDETDFRLEMEGISVRADFHDSSYTLQVARRDEFYKLKTKALFGIERDFHQMSLHIADYLVVEPRLNPSPFDEGTEAVERGRSLFFSNEVGCAACHPPPTFSSPKLFQGITTLGKYDRPRRDLDPDISVKFVEKAVDGAFNANTLRGLWDRKGALFHDGRARTIRETLLTPNHKCLQPGERAFNEFNGQVDTNGGISQLECEQIDDLVAFLKTID